ncbi:MAG TPA: hypothetical protein VKA95_00425 [Nitrososphaeraceae archaeon]|nr:hypothetical protein [Nitrososphaeraceae archaeon]
MQGLQADGLDVIFSLKNIIIVIVIVVAFKCSSNNYNNCKKK